MEGTVLGGYRIEAPIGAGGVGRVFRAVHVDLERPVALKVLRANAGDPGAARRFEREAQVAITLRHPRLVSVLDAGIDGGQRYIAMELVEGETLDHLIAREGALAPARAVRLARDVAEGLAYLHASGILHRDVKPSNVIVDRSGRARLLDFGLALPLDATRLTESGVVVGTLAYCAPEVLDGEDHTPASDMWGLGCLLDEMLPADRGPGPLADLVRKLRQRDPARRQLTSARVFELLAGIERAAARQRPRRSWKAAAAATAATALLVAVFVTAPGTPRPPPSPPPSPAPERFESCLKRANRLREDLENLGARRARTLDRAGARELHLAMRRLEASLLELSGEVAQPPLEQLPLRHAEAVMYVRGLECHFLLWSSRWREPGVAGARRWRTSIGAESLVGPDSLVAADVAVARAFLDTARRMARLTGDRIRSAPGAYLAGLAHVAGAGALAFRATSRHVDSAMFTLLDEEAHRAFDAFNNGLVPAAAAPAPHTAARLERLLVRTWLWSFRAAAHRDSLVVREPSRMPFTRDAILGDYRELEALVPEDRREQVAVLRAAAARQ